MSSNALVASIRGYQPGETIELTYMRDGEKKTAEVTLDSDGGKLSHLGATADVRIRGWMSDFRSWSVGGAP